VFHDTPRCSSVATASVLVAFAAVLAVAGSSCRGPGDADADADADIADADSSDAGDAGDADGADAGPRDVVVATWNLHNLSPYGDREYRLDAIAERVLELDVDLLAVQELKVEDGTAGEPPQAWDALLERLEGYEGVHNPWDTTDSTVGLIYRTATAEVVASQPILDEDSWAFPRPPLEARVEVSTGQGTVTFGVIVVHLKAFADSLDRRRAACEQLAAYLDGRDEDRYLLLGDWNDDPHDPASENAFAGTFLGTEPAFYFLTDQLPPESVSSVSYHHEVDGQEIRGEFLDHLVVTGALHGLFSSLAPRIESVPESGFDQHEAELSDHFPVLLTMTP
jgi:endonuclease/exonuclease/phosphatase family metal-dependent hydrolase